MHKVSTLTAQHAQLFRKQPATSYPFDGILHSDLRQPPLGRQTLENMGSRL
jgi:hypothetical protein